MLQDVEKNERRTKLKKYRGILLAKISNNVLLHDQLTINPHKPGTQMDVCDACCEYIDDKRQFDMVGKLLDCDDEAEQELNKQVKKHYFYRVHDRLNNEYIVRAHNKEHALQLLNLDPQSALTYHPEQISRKEAMEEIRQFDGEEKAQLAARYLRENDYYVGTVSSNVHISMIPEVKLGQR